MSAPLKELHCPACGTFLCNIRQAEIWDEACSSCSRIWELEHDPSGYLEINNSPRDREPTDLDRELRNHLAEAKRLLAKEPAI